MVTSSLLLPELLVTHNRTYLLYANIFIYKSKSETFDQEKRYKVSLFYFSVIIPKILLLRKIIAQNFTIYCMIIHLAIALLLQIERPFNQVTISGNNQVYNSGLPTWVDTVVHVGLDVSGLKAQNVFVSKMPDDLSENLKGFVSFKSGNFYIYLQDFDRRESIEVISHELVHVKQFASGELFSDEETGSIIWQGEPMQIEALDYDIRPWEREAFNQQSELSFEILSILY